MDDFAIKVENVSKTFKLPHEKSNSIKSAVVGFSKRKKGYELQKALDNVSFEVKKGEFFGIVGRNGSGKSTLLKLLAEIYVPTEGQVHIRGSLTPFIELGVGFSPELTGRENVYLNGALLGFDRKEMQKMYNDIVEFAELKRFMDQKLKNYSSGMQVRLAFSIAIRANTNILVLDEVLAVGDEAFQKKCYSYFDRLKKAKTTVILVTHDMSAVERFCNKALLINNGAIKLNGDPHMVAAEYSRINDEIYDKTLQKIKSQQKPDFQIDILNKAGKSATSFNHMDTLRVRLKWHQAGVKNAGVAIFRDNGEYVFGPNTYQDKYQLKVPNQIEYSVKLNLNEGTYFLKAGLLGETDNEMISFIEEGPHFMIKKNYDSGKWGGVTKLDYKWQ